MRKRKMQKQFMAISFAILLVFQVLIPSFQGLSPVLATNGNPCEDEASGFSGGFLDRIHSPEGKSGEGITEDVYTPDNVSQSVYQHVPQGLNFGIHAAAVEIENNIISNVVLKDEDGNIIDADENPQNVIALGDVAHICMDWSLPNTGDRDYGAGSTFTFTLPEYFEVFNDVEGNLVFETNNMGSFYLTMDTKQVVMTFNEQIDLLSNIKGQLWFETIISEEIVGSVDQDIVFNIKGKEVAKIPVQFQPPSGSEINKRGAVDRGYNATEITWTVDFNKQLKSIENAVFSDPIQENLELKSGSVKVYRLDVQLDGSVIAEENEVPTSEYTLTEDPFTISFNDISDAYRVEYVTNITDDVETTYSNTATVSGDNITDLSAGATVTTGRGIALAKRSAGYDVDTQTITWEIKYNYNEKDIEQVDAKLVDVFTDEHGLNPTSFKVEQITIDEDGNEEGSTVVSNYTMTPSADSDGFTLQFTDKIKHAYKITYTTTANDRVIDNGRITNQVTSENGHEAGAGQDTEHQVLFKWHTNLNYNTKTVDWVIDINRDSEEMKQLVVTDTFSNKGLTLDESTFKITNIKTGAKLVEGVGQDYTFVNNHPDGFVVTFLSPIHDRHQITYTTEFEYDDLTDDRFTNHVKIDWVDSLDRVQEKSASSSFEPDQYTRQNGFKNGSYNAVDKIITWEIGVNYDLKELTNIQVTDQILGVQNLDEDSINVYEADLTGGVDGIKAGNPLVEGIGAGEYTLNVVDNSGQKEIQITIHGTTSKAYWIEFQTSLEDELIVDRYDNVAEFTSDGVVGTTELPAHVTVEHGGSYVNKSGLQNNKVVNWTININFGQSYISNASVLDEQEANQILLEDSFILFATTVDTDGSVNKDIPLVEDEDYILTIETANDGSQTFELEFTAAYIDKPYILEYQSYINAGNGEEISNSVTFSGEQITTETVESGDTIVIRSSGGGGTGSGELGSLEVLKVDAETGDPLEGAVFTLYDSEERFAIRTVETDEDGKAVFERLLYDDYLLREDQAPDGYVVGIDDTRTVTIDASSVQVTVENKKIIRAVELKKTDADVTAETLQGAVFSLQKQDGSTYKEISQHTTNEQGLITLIELEPGNYQFVEVTAPVGYELDDTPIPFVITAKQIEIIELQKENDIILGAVEIVKVDQYDNSITLENVEFELLDEAGITLENGLETNADGKLLIENLRPGNYQLKETQAAEHYELPAVPFEFTIALGQTEPLEITLENKMIPGAVEIVKVDKDDNTIVLEGVKFDLHDGNGNVLQTNLSTDTDGKLFIGDLRPGDYSLIETEPYEHYNMPDEPFDFTIVKSQTDTLILQLENELIRGAVEILKVDEYDHSITLEGVEFELQDEAGIPIESGLKTNADGKLLIEDLKPGEYQLVETTAAEHYVPLAEPIAFTIVKSQAQPLEITVENKLRSGAVEIVKVDQDDNSIVLEGVTFDLHDDRGNVLRTNLITDTEGKLFIGDLRPGNYSLYETEPYEHYSLPDEPFPFTIVKSQQDTLFLQLENELITGAAEIVKVDQDDHTIALQGVTFDLLDEAGNVLRSHLTTGADGKLLIEYLKPGNYALVETGAAEHYEPLSEPVEFTIVDSQLEPVEILVENKMIPGAVELTKVSAQNPNRFLRGAVFELQDRDGNVLMSGLETNENGKLRINELRPGDYQFVETKAPERYSIDRTPYEFTIVPSQAETLEITFKNTFIPFTPFPPGPINPETPDPETPGPETPDPTDPSDPSDPSEPADPTDPTDPSDSNDPSEPVDPADPTESEDPSGDLDTDGASGDENAADVQEPGDTEGVPGIGTPSTETPSTSEASNQPESNVSEESDGASDEETLPQTGEENLLYMMLIGIFFLLAGSSVLVYRKVKRN